MEELYNFELSESTILSMLELNPELAEITKEEVIAKENILKEIRCTDIQIRNIISCNSIFLTRTNEEIINLLNYLYTLGFKFLNILLDSNPYILNLDNFEIENYIKKRKNNGENLENIIDDLDSNPYLFNEM